MKWAHKAKIAATSGAFDYAQKVYDWSARIREVTITVRSLSEEQERKWRAFFLRVDGQAGTFTLTPTNGKYPTGAIFDKYCRWHGDARVNGSGQTGKVLQVSGLPPDEEAAIAGGDWFSIGGVLHEAIDDVSSDASGNGEIKLWRALAVAPAHDSQVVLDHPQGEFKLLGDIPEMAWTKEKRGEGFTFRAREVLL